MDITILKITIPFAFMLLLLPILLRFFIGRIILILVKKRYINKGVLHELDGERDKEALLKVEAILFKKLSSPFLQTYDLKNELISIALSVQNSYLDEEQEELHFSFSVSDLIKCYFLLMSDINQIINKTSLLHSLKKSRISTLKRISRVSGYYNYLYNRIPFLKVLRKGRITGKIIRILFIPILGLPSILLSIVISLISIFFTEIIWKYYYSVMLVKCAYYSILLYGNKNSLIKESIMRFSPDKIKKMAETVEELINPENILFRSEFFENAFIEYQKTLELFGITPEKDINFDGVKYRFNKKRKFLKKAMDIPLNVMKQYNPFYEKSFSDREQLLELVYSITSVYYSQKEFYDDLRILDIFEICYMASVLAYYKLLFSSKILENLSVDFILKAKNINDEVFNEILKNKIPLYKQIYRSFKLIRKSRILYKAVRSTNPVALIVSFSGPIAVESVKTQIRDYIYQRAGRFTLYCLESNKLKRDNVFIIPEDY